ncbi:MAG: hypothetical protein IIB00_07235 [candidate division Zixibacteria bacterium]|nr:hypothetical protein [candidate division Zixibacteria bacterium]
MKGNGFRIFLAVIAGLAAYFLMIQEIKTEIAGKADSSIVLRIDNKLSRLEAFAQDRRSFEAEFKVFRDETIRRLARIESLLENDRGKK